MFRFDTPQLLYLLLLVPLLAAVHYWTNLRKRRRLRRFGDPALLRPLMRDRSLWRPEVKLWLCLGALACLILAAARPQYGTRIDTTERHGIEAIIAIDVSNSMLARDVRPSRLERAKMLFSNMIDGMRQDRVGLVVFAGDAFTQLPITNDHVSAQMFLEHIGPDLVRLQGTDIAQAINLARKSFTQKPGVSRAIFLITDGEDNEGGAIEAAQAAAEQGMHVYVLGIGSPEGAHIPIPGTAQHILDETGNPVRSRLDERMCREIARAGQGAYIYVDNSTSAQEALSKHLEKLAKSKLESQVYSEYDEQFQGFLLLAALFLLLDVLLLERANRLVRSLHLFRRLSLLLLLLALPPGMRAQNSSRDHIRRGNRLFRDSLYDRAQVEYRKAFQKDSNSVQAQYNLANTLLRQGQPKEAMRLLEKAARSERHPVRRARIFHNMGLILQSQRQFREAIYCYRESLRRNPSDHETRYNMVLCQRQLKDQPQQDDPQQRQEGGDPQQQEQQEQPKPDSKQERKQEQKPRENQMTRENAEQMLKAALQSERNTQDKLNRQQQPQQRRLKKQW